MAFFNFRRKIDIAKDYSLEEIPVFSSLTSAELISIEKKARLLEFKRGDVVYKQGEPAEAFYVVISGRFRLSAETNQEGSEEAITHFYRSDHFGETSLLNEAPHSGTVQATKDGIILKLDKADFLTFIKEIPSISLHLSRSLGHRLTKKHDDQGSREVRISALYSRASSDEVMSLWFDFAASLNQKTNSPVILIDFCRHQGSFVAKSFKEKRISAFNLSVMEPSSEGELKNRIQTHESGFDYIYSPADGVDNEVLDERKIRTLITFLTYRYNYLLIRLPAEIGNVTFKAMRQSDFVYVYSGPTAVELGQVAEAIHEFQQSYGFSKSEIKILTPERHEQNAIPYAEQEEVLGTPLFSIVPSKVEQPERYKSVLRYLSKELAGILVGLVLGSGAAYGLAHIGVLRVLEEEGIEVDVVAGSSIGALIGAFWAAGYDSKQLEKIALSINKKTGFFRLIGFRDLSIAHKGFIKGNQVKRFMKSLVGDKTFQDLRIPVKIAAADLFTSEEVVFETGSVVDAIRASISIPGIFRPFPYQGKYLIDGGVIDPLPVRVLTKAGIRKIIAVNVLAGPKDRVERNILRRDHRKRVRTALEEKNFWSRIFAKGFNQVQNRYAVNIFNVIMSTVQFMEYEIANSWADQADILIHPIVPEGHWAEFYSPEKFIEVGYQRAREQIEGIRKLVAE